MQGLWNHPHLNRLVLNENTGICIVVSKPAKKETNVIGVLFGQYSPGMWAFIILSYEAIVFLIRRFGHFTNAVDARFNVFRLYILATPDPNIWTKFENFLVQPMCFILFIIHHDNDDCRYDNR